MAGEKILIVEDNELHSRLASYVLTIKGFEVSIVTNAKEALDILKTTQFNLILMDIQLPDIDGLTLTRQLRADPQFKNIPIIAITAYAMKGDKERVLEAGCNFYIAKPIDVKTFPDTIEGFIRKK